MYRLFQETYGPGLQGLGPQRPGAVGREEDNGQSHPGPGQFCLELQTA